MNDMNRKFYPITSETSMYFNRELTDKFLQKDMKRCNIVYDPSRIFVYVCFFHAITNTAIKRICTSQSTTII